MVAALCQRQPRRHRAPLHLYPARPDRLLRLAQGLATAFQLSDGLARTGEVLRACGPQTAGEVECRLDPAELPYRKEIIVDSEPGGLVPSPALECKAGGNRCRGEEAGGVLCGACF